MFSCFFVCLINFDWMPDTVNFYFVGYWVFLYLSNMLKLCSGMWIIKKSVVFLRVPFRPLLHRISGSLFLSDSLHTELTLFKVYCLIPCVLRLVEMELFQVLRIILSSPFGQFFHWVQMKTDLFYQSPDPSLPCVDSSSGFSLHTLAMLVSPNCHLHYLRLMRSSCSLHPAPETGNCPGSWLW